MHREHQLRQLLDVVSMKSGLEGRNNVEFSAGQAGGGLGVSMKSGLEGRNNRVPYSRISKRPWISQ